MSLNNITDQLPEQAKTTLTTGSMQSCLRNRNDPPKKQSLDRRVSFPQDDQNIVTGFLEPANPWEFANNVSQDELIASYKSSCEKHGVRPLHRVISQLQMLDYKLDRNENLDLKGEMLGPSACETLEEILKRLQFVTINLEGTNLDDESAVALFDMMEYYESAVRLNITGNHCIAARGWQACSRMIKRTKCLEELDARNTTLTEQFMPILSRALRLCTLLHVLKLENCNLSGRPIVILTAALKLNTGLKELYLGENYLMPNDASQLSALLKVNTVLQLLDISNNNIQDEGLGLIVEGLLEQNSSGGGLQVLVLWNNHLSRSCGHHLSRVFTNCTSLETINIGQNVLSNEVMHVNKLALQQNHTLLRLGMQSTHLSCEGAVSLAEVIADNTIIQRIDLRDNNVQIAGLMALMLSMKVNTTVTQLDLDDTPRRKHSMGPALEEYMKLVGDIRGYCRRNAKIMEKTDDLVEEIMKEETILPTIERRPRTGSFATRKISLTCETLSARSQAAPVDIEPSSQLLMEPKRTGGRLRSPAPSPIPSPVASPSPTRSRFQVSRVSESDSPITPSISSTNVFFGTNSRFKVTVVESSSSTIPTTVPTSHNLTVGFEAPTNISTNTSISPAPSPTPIPAPLLSSIPSLFPTPMPSPMPSPLLSPNPSPTYISPLSTINVGEANLISPLPSKEDNLNQRDVFKKPFETSPIPVTVSDSKVDVPFKNNKDVISTINNEPINVNKGANDELNKNGLSCKPALKEAVTEETTSSTDKSLIKDNIQSNISLNPRNSVSPPKVSKLRSESEESDKEFYLNRRLPKAIDSIDLSASRVTKQASVSVSEKAATSSSRVRKISSWVQPSAVFSSISQEDSGKPSSSLERLLSLFVNPFLRTKVEEEPPQQLENVPEIAECSTSKKENVDEELCQKTDIISNTYINLDDSTQNSNNSQLLINDCPADTSCELYKNTSINDSVSSDNSTLKSCPTRNGCEPICDKQDVNIPFIFNSNDSLSDSEFGGTRCKTWPQGTNMAQLNFVHSVQNQSHSAPCLTALVFLNSKLSSNLKAEIQKIPNPSNEERVDSTKNISLAL